MHTSPFECTWTWHLTASLAVPELSVGRHSLGQTSLTRPPAAFGSSRSGRRKGGCPTRLSRKGESSVRSVRVPPGQVGHDWHRGGQEEHVVREAFVCSSCTSRTVTSLWSGTLEWAILGSECDAHARTYEAHRDLRELVRKVSLLCMRA